jgi:ankyrin repeat protein
MVKLVIEKGEDAKTRDRLGYTPLMFAAAEGDLEMMKLLMAKGADVNIQMEPSTNTVKNGPIAIGRLSPLMFAAKVGGGTAAARRWSGCQRERRSLDDAADAPSR